MTNYSIDLNDGITLNDLTAGVSETFPDAVSLIVDVLMSAGIKNIYKLMDVKSIDVRRAMSSYVVYKYSDEVEVVGWGGNQEILKDLIEIDVMVYPNLQVSTIINNLSLAILNYNYTGKTINGERIAWIILKDADNVKDQRGITWVNAFVEVARIRKI